MFAIVTTAMTITRGEFADEWIGGKWKEIKLHNLDDFLLFNHAQETEFDIRQEVGIACLCFSWLKAKIKDTVSFLARSLEHVYKYKAAW